MSNIDYAGNFVDFLKETSGDGPWCFWYGTMEPHRGFEYGVGVANGTEASKAVADHVTEKTNNQGAVAEAVRRFALR